MHGPSYIMHSDIPEFFVLDKIVHFLYCSECLSNLIGINLPRLLISLILLLSMVLMQSWLATGSWVTLLRI
jgi:putative effector of murein hydrolase LrgA (UPF0299 family)